MKKMIPALAVVLASGCGGGGSDGSSGTALPLSTSQFPVESVLASTLSVDTTLPATTCIPSVNGFQVTASQRFIPQTDASSRWSSAITKKTVSQITLLAGGISQAQMTTRYSFSLQPLVLLGHETSHYPQTVQRGEYAQYVTDANLPTTAAVGAKGPFFHYDALDLIDGSLLNHGVTSWSLDADTTNTAWLCLNNKITSAITNSVSTQYYCYLIDATGKILQDRFNGTVNDQSLTCG